MKPLIVRILLAVVVLTGTASWAQQALPQLKVRDPRAPQRIACVGDSITFGAGIEGRETNCYPAVLDRLFPANFDVRNFGVSGATLLRKGDKPYWNEPEFKELAKFNPRMIILKLGTNDSKPQNWAHKDAFEADLKAMLDHFRTFEAAPVVLLCLPAPVYEDRWGINEKTVKEEIIPILQKVAKERNLKVVDLHTALSGHPEMFPDKVHPNAAGAALMARTVLSAMRNKAP